MHGIILEVKWQYANFNIDNIIAFSKALIAAHGAPRGDHEAVE